MTTNVGHLDRVIRIAFGILLIALPFLTNYALWQSLWATGIAVVVGLVLIATAAVRFCPAYRLFGLRTCRPA